MTLSKKILSSLGVRRQEKYVAQLSEQKQKNKNKKNRKEPPSRSSRQYQTRTKANAGQNNRHRLEKYRRNFNNTRKCSYIILIITLILVSRLNISLHHSFSSMVSDDMAISTFVNKPFALSISPKPTRSLSIVVHLEGAFGNHLSKIAMGKIIQSMARQYGFNQTSLHIMSQTKNFPGWKWYSEEFRTRNRRSCKRCFPNLRNLMFLEGNEENFIEYSRKHDVELGPEQASYLKIDRSFCRQLDCNVAPIEKAFETVQNVWQRGELNLQSGRWNSTFKKGAVLGPYSFPMITTNQFPVWHMFGRFYDEFVDFFQVDEKCFEVRAHPDEVVFYYRNFAECNSPVNTDTKRPWYIEMSHDDISRKLLGHMKSGEKLAIVTRERKNARPLIRLMKDRNVTVRVIHNGENLTKDFFFLLSAQREMIGLGVSTFYEWATLLNREVKRARLYFLDDGSELKSRFFPAEFPPVIENQELQERLEFELYKI